MGKYYIVKNGQGKFVFFKPVSISEKEARKLKANGEEIFDSKEKAYERALEKKRE